MTLLSNLRRAGIAVGAASLVAACTQAPPRPDRGTPPGTTPRPPAESSRLPLAHGRDVVLPGGATELDYLDIDPIRQRLFVAHRGDDAVDAIDLRTLRVVGTVHGVGAAHGVRVAPDLHKVFASATATNEVVAFDEDTLTVLSRTSVGEHPDGLGYDPRHQKVYVSNERDHAESVLDARTGRAVGLIELGSESGNTIWDPGTGHILVNAQTAGHIAVIDPVTDTVIDKVPTPGCEVNHGLAVDSRQHVAFVACEDNATFLVVNLSTKATLATFPIAADPDGVAYDQALGRVYVAHDDGSVAVFARQRCGFAKVAQDVLEDAAHTVAVDPFTHAVYFPIEHLNGHDVVRVVTPTRLRRTERTEPAAGTDAVGRC
jgi:DNA-binding beta-propeller fold protein YncE